MDVEKVASKGHGFFGLFDWGKNKKSKKRLFNGSSSDSPNPRSIGDEKEIDGGAPSTRSNSILEDAPSLKESSEHSCSSSVIDEEAPARRCPTVVARLMGLDSMPVASSSESSLPPLAVQPPFQTNSHDDLVGRSYVDSPLKMPSSPIDRFKMEALPPRYAKRTLSVAQYKLLSPMKNSNPISSRNAADIMEAASRIIGHGVENIIPNRVQDVGHTNAVRAYNTREIIGVQQRSHKLNEELRKRGGSALSQPPSGKPLGGVLKSSESTLSSRTSVSNGIAPVRSKVRASNRSSNVARAVQAQGKEEIRKDTSDAKLDVIDGDYLGLLLEQKLRELTSGVKSPYLKPAKDVQVYAPSPILEDTASTCETSSITSDGDRELTQSFKDGKATLPQTDCIRASGQSPQPVKYNNDVVDQAELEQPHLSPLSTWEASLSTETCSSSESWRSANGTRLFSSTDGATTSESAHFNKCLEVDALSEYSDTASSITVATAEIPRSESSSSCHMDYRQEVEFIRELLNAASISRIFSCLERLGNSDILEPHLLEELDGNFSLVAGEESKANILRRRLLFDCVNELLSVKCAYYFNAGYSSWYMGMAVLQNLSVDDLHREMTSLKVAEEWMVDELVYREMSGPLGSWVDFKMESYQVAGDMTTELLGSLVDEVVADLLTGSFL
ncbi:hypothetical protein QOZ80_3BG0254680 [Eleusine coracana subsp. coracana]|nr:hypothetical protein QOZ80_3BG0254680 [Eleusine coracana subsp. coracana]